MKGNFKRKALFVIITLFIIIGFIYTKFFLLKGYTQPIKDLKGNVLPNSVASLEKVEIGDTKQWLLMRGNDMDKPVILFLHGGPGTAEMPLIRHYNSSLEKNFIVVSWDQRGAGKSYTGPIPKEEATIDQFVCDTHEVVEYLKKRFNKDKIYLVGHSWGSMLGMLTVEKYPESFYAYIGTGQEADMIEGELLSYQYVLKKAKELHNTKAISELEQAGPPKNGFYKDEESEQIERKWVLKFGNSLYGKKNYNEFYKIILFSKEYTMKDIVNFFNFAYPDEFMQEYHTTNLFEKVPEVKVPVYFFLGRNDNQIPADLAQQYLNKLKASKKELVWFEKSAHSPQYEEAEKFNYLITEKVMKETYE